LESEEDLMSMQTDFIALQIEWMRKIISKKQSLLEGVWYATDYYRACQDVKRQKLAATGVTFHGYGPEEFVEFVEDRTSPTGYRIYTFAAKKGQKASAVIAELCRGVSLLDCGTVCYLASCLALCAILTPEKFDHLFDPAGPFPFILTGDESCTISRLLPKQVIQSEQEVVTGDICYFCNCREYTAKHPAGEARGFNVVCCGGVNYLGFGLCSEGVSREGVEHNLWKSFNLERFLL
jgi:hypothetical protein